MVLDNEGLQEMTITVSITLPSDMEGYEVSDRKIEEWISDVIKGGFVPPYYVVYDKRAITPHIIIERETGVESDAYFLHESGSWLLSDEDAERFEESGEV